MQAAIICQNKDLVIQYCQNGVDLKKPPTLHEAQPPLKSAEYLSVDYRKTPFNVLAACVKNNLAVFEILYEKGLDLH
jgi:hypothetical protein